MRIPDVLKTVAAAVCVILALSVWSYIAARGNSDVRRTADTAAAVTAGGDIEAGRLVIENAGCAACHEIPGVRGAQGKIGPSLKDFKSRATVAGVRANTPRNLANWIKDPRAIDPQTAMPALGLSDEEAKNAAAYLYAVP